VLYKYNVVDHRRVFIDSCEYCVCDKGMIALILETIDKCSQWKSMRHLAHLIGEDSAAKWNDMINYLYLLLGTSDSQSV